MEVTIPEMKKILGIIFPDENNSETGNKSIFQSIFLSILEFLHNDNGSVEVSQLVDLFVVKFKTVYTLGKNVSIDEEPIS